MIKQFMFIFFVSMVPLAELRVAIPLAIGMNLPIIPSYIISVIGNMLPVPFIYLFPRATSQAAALARIFGDCREGRIPRSSAAQQA